MVRDSGLRIITNINFLLKQVTYKVPTYRTCQHYGLQWHILYYQELMVNVCGQWADSNSMPQGSDILAGHDKNVFDPSSTHSGAWSVKKDTYY